MRFSLRLTVQVAIKGYMKSNTPRILVAGTSGDGGKTMLALGLVSALRLRGLDIAPFKKGPDYIDAAWLGQAASRPCANLDVRLMGADTVLRSFARRSDKADIAIIEGNRGLHDGSNAEGTHSSAQLAKLLQAPVLLVIDATKATRSLAAIVLGFMQLDPDLSFAGVVLNRVAGPRHVKVATEAIESICNIPVLGAIPKLKDAGRIPGRHLGLLPVDEYPDYEGALSYAGEVIEKYVDLDRLSAIASKAEPLEFSATVEPSSQRPKSVRIGVLHDGAFSFYYPENVQALQVAGAAIVEVNSLESSELPQLDALYIGGGFPETHAERLVGNEVLRRSIAQAAKDGLPIYAECGGLMYLSHSIEWQGSSYPMCDVLPVRVRMHEKPQGHGYSRMRVDQANPFFDRGEVFEGHEFHYSSIEAIDVASKPGTCCEVLRGVGVGQGREGLLFNNVLAMYTHLHALATPSWAIGMVGAARRYRSNGAVLSGGGNGSRLLNVAGVY